MNKTSYAFGVCSILVILSLLCLTVFALLSVNTAKAGERLSTLQAQAISDYYEAEAQANLILAKLRGGEIPQGVEQEGDIYSYRCRINDNTDLYVKAQVNSRTDINILCWQSVSSNEWTPESNLPVWDGNQ